MQWLKDLINFLAQPQYFVVLSVIGFFTLLFWRNAWSKTSFLVGNLMLTVFFAVSSLDPNFNKVITKPDNVPIIIMVYLVWWCLWGAMNQAVANDRRLESGLPPAEQEVAQADDLGVDGAAQVKHCADPDDL